MTTDAEIKTRIQQLRVVDGDLRRALVDAQTLADTGDIDGATAAIDEIERQSYPALASSGGVVTSSFMVQQVQATLDDQAFVPIPLVVQFGFDYRGADTFESDFYGGTFAAGEYLSLTEGTYWAYWTGRFQGNDVDGKRALGLDFLNNDFGDPETSADPFNANVGFIRPFFPASSLQDGNRFAWQATLRVAGEALLLSLIAFQDSGDQLTFDSGSLSLIKLS